MGTRTMFPTLCSPHDERFPRFFGSLFGNFGIMLLLVLPMIPNGQCIHYRGQFAPPRGTVHLIGSVRGICRLRFRRGGSMTAVTTAVLACYIVAFFFFFAPFLVPYRQLLALTSLRTRTTATTTSHTAHFGSPQRAPNTRISTTLIRCSIRLLLRSSIGRRIIQRGRRTR